MEFLPDDLAAYIENHTSAESELMAKLNRETHLKVLKPRMLSGHLQGKFLTFLTQLLRPKNILEIGTYTGYSAMAFLEGMTDEAHLVTIDNNEELKPIHEQFLLQHPRAKQLSVRIGNALEIIPTLEQSFDLVFIDADKPNYSNYFNAVIDKMPIGGILLADNVLWSGKVVEPIKSNDKSTNALLAFNKEIHENNRVENVLIPIRDGIMAARKVK